VNQTNSVLKEGVMKRTATCTIVIVALIVTVGCGSTKVYNTDKTVIYKGSMYNISNVTHFSSRIEAKTSAGDTVNLAGYDKSRFEALVAKEGTAMVQSLIIMDDQTIVYQSATLTKYSQFDKMRKSLASAMDQIANFMKKKKTTQLNLK
jgi:regulatory protein YycH of two-component signal transduction system YycFG